MGQVARNVARVKVLRANQLNRGAFEHPKIPETGQGPWSEVEVRGELPIMFLAHVSRILDRFLDDIMDVLVNESQIDWLA